MLLLNSVAMLGCLTLGVQGQKAQCCLPDQLSGKEGIVYAQVVKGEASVTLIDMTVAIDQKLKKTHAIGSVFTAERKLIRLETLQDYTQQTQYVVLDGKCTTSKLRKWKPLCIPAEAKLTSRTYLGSSPNILRVADYGIWVKGVTVFVTTTDEEECIIINEGIYGTAPSGVPYTTSLQFSNVTRSVDDPSVFDVPAACKHGQYSWQEDTRQRSFILGL